MEESCEICSENRLKVSFDKILKESRYVIIEYIFANKSGQIKLPTGFLFNEFLENTRTNAKFRLVSTINRPTPSHFSCCLYEPQFLHDEMRSEGWFIHDGLKNQGKLVRLDSINNVCKQKPMILFYKRTDIINQ